MSAAQYRWTVCDPVHRILDFGARAPVKGLVKDLVASRSFQRLRRISQLGLAAHVFPGATHSRFAHCLGAAHLARVVTLQLSDSEERYKAEVDRYTPLIVAAALVHDIGHGPFSHAFERALMAVTGIKVKHEAWTRAIIRGPLRTCILDNGVDVEQLASIFGSSDKLDPLPLYIKQIVSSQVDVDRMDYLVRDAHFSGVPLGNIDLHYLIRSLAIVEHGAGHSTLGVTRKGVRAYEAFALARHLMNRTVYYHAKVAVLELLMEECLREIATGVKAGLDASGIAPSLKAILSATADSSDDFVEANVEAYLGLGEDHVWTAIGHVEQSWEGPAKTLATRFGVDPKKWTVF